MYGLMYKNKGAISIFLLIVLVPMIILSSLFVDMSRMTLAKSVMESAGALTLNTALTGYDAVLKDMYGLFATSQTTDELFENLEDYYRQCIESAGVAESDADDYVAMIMDFLKSETGTDDLLNMNLTSFEVTKPENGNLANPAVLKSQIVEFMKYRAPINLGTGIFDALSSFKNMKKQSKLVDNKNKFYSEHSAMLELLESIWNDLEDYQYRDAYTTTSAGGECAFPEGSYLKKSKESLDPEKAELDTAVAYIVRYLYFAGTYYGAMKDANGKSVYGITVEESDDDTVWTVKQTSDHKYTVEASPEDTTPEDVRDALKDAYKAIKAMEKDYALYTELTKGNSNMSDTEKIRLVAKFRSTLSDSYHTAVLELVESLVELKNAKAGCEDLAEYYVKVNGDSLSFSGGKVEEDDSDDSESEDSEDSDKKKKTPPWGEKEPGSVSLTTFVDDQLKHLSEDGEYIKNYNKVVSRIEGYWDGTKGIVSEARKYVADETLDAKNKASWFYNFLDDKSKKLNEALAVITTVKNQLNDPESKYNKALAAWKSSANGLSNDMMGENDLSEIARLEKVLTSDSIGKLYTRVNNAKNTIDDLKKSVEGFKAFGTSWKGMGGNSAITYSTLEGLMSAADKKSISDVTASKNTATQKIGDYTATYDKAYDTVVATLQAKIVTSDIKTEWEGAELAKSPDLRKDQVTLYTWLFGNFFVQTDVEKKFKAGKTFGYYVSPAETDTNDSNDISANKNNADAPRDEMEKKADDLNDDPTAKVTNPDRSYDAGYLPSGRSELKLAAVESGGKVGGDSEKLLADSGSDASGSLGMFDKLIELVGDMATTLRDDMYIANYIMNMFSYSTYEAEIAVKNGEEGKAFEPWYTCNGETKEYELSSTFKTYTNYEQMLKDARTLTKVPINPNANHLYGKEVEYIIYGGLDLNGDGDLTEKDDPLIATYGTIYMLRFALNTIYAFTDAEIGNLTTAAATALFGTPPLTPLIPVAKIAMTIGMALAESAYDLYQLKCGAEIPLIKNAKTWVMKPSSAAEAVLGEIASKGVDLAIDKGLQVLNDALEMTDEQLTALINDEKAKFDGLVDAAVDNTIKEFENYANQALQEAFSICSEVNAEARGAVEYVKGKTDEKIEAVSKKLDTWLAAQTAETDAVVAAKDTVYAAKKAAVDYLKAEEGKVIGELLDVIDNVTGIATKEELADAIQKELDDVQLLVNKEIDKLSDQAGNALCNAKNAIMNDLKDAAKEGAESLRSTLKAQIGSAFGTSAVKTDGTNKVVSSLLSWSYSDYLQLFLLVGLVASPESVLLRTADVIELNMRLIDGTRGYVDIEAVEEVSWLWGLIKYPKKVTKRVENEDAYSLSKSYTYLTIKATVEVEPLLLTMPFVYDTVRSQATGIKWYQINYEGTMGY